MLLTKPEILKAIAAKKIRIEPFHKTSVGPASIDLTLDNEIRIFHAKRKVVSENTDYKSITKKISINNGYLFKPGELVLGITKEKITLPDNIAGWINSRSRFARIGLMSHITAPFIAPGVSNKQVLEIYNAGPQTIRLMPNTKICQLVLQQCKGKAKYTGTFKHQEL